MKRAEEFVSKTNPDHVWNSKMALYALKQDPRE